MGVNGQRGRTDTRTGTRARWPLLLAVLCPCSTACADERIDVTPTGVHGRYEGREFITRAEAAARGLRGNDVAHQLSNHVADAVGAELASRARAGAPARVDLTAIRMTTAGMDNRGHVVYTVDIPLVPENSGAAATHFDHRGGWGHEGEDIDAWRARIRERYRVDPECSPKIRTPEGLVETWCQWGAAPAGETQAPARVPDPAGSDAPTEQESDQQSR